MGPSWSLRFICEPHQELPPPPHPKSILEPWACVSFRIAKRTLLPDYRSWGLRSTPLSFPPLPGWLKEVCAETKLSSLCNTKGQHQWLGAVASCMIPGQGNMEEKGVLFIMGGIRQPLYMGAHRPPAHTAPSGSAGILHIEEDFILGKYLYLFTCYLLESLAMNPGENRDKTS